MACARCEGYANSVTSTGAADAANVSPNPIRNLVASPLVSIRLFDNGTRYLPGANEHVDRVGGGLDDGRRAHDESTEDDSGATPGTIGYVRREWVRGQAADVLDSVQETQLRKCSALRERTPNETSGDVPFQGSGC